ncbi:MAG TPA: EAL domain-containing protein [Bryobacteraceae bacterium]|nr:EAL domain-containing protein [Bryobacteraceae bacterium]
MGLAMLIAAAGVLLAVLLSVYVFKTERPCNRAASQRALLIRFSKVRSEQVDSPDAALEWLVDALPAACRHPGVACARATLDGRSFASRNFRETPWRQQAEIVVGGKLRGELQVCYRESTAAAGRDPFCPEEHALLDEVARDIGLLVRRLESESQLRTASHILERSPVVLYRVRLEPSLPLTYISQNISQYGYQADEFLAAPDFYRTLVHPDDQAKVRESQERVLAGAEVDALEFRLRAGDGSWHWVRNYVTATREEGGHPRDAEGMLVDITPAKLATEELRKRESILHAVTKVAAGLLEAPVLDQALAAALSEAGEAVGADRVLVLETRLAPDGSALVRERCIWSGPGVEPRIQPGFLESRPDLAAIPGAFFASLPKGEILATLPRRIEGDFAGFLRSLNVQSFLLMPILVEAERWGYLAFDDCHTERVWTTAECDTLQVLAEMIGASVAREGRTAKLAEAQRIVENSTTVLYRTAAEPNLPLTYISANVSRWGYRPEQFTAAATFHLTLVHPDDQAGVAAWIQGLLADSPAASSLEFRVRFRDRSYHWFENRITPIRDDTGQVRGFEGTLTDVDERKRAAEELRKRDRILDAIARIAAELMAAPSPEAAVPEVLHLAGEAVGADRVIVLENTRSPEGAALVCERYTWNAPGAEPQTPPGFLKSQPETAAALRGLCACLPQGQLFAAHPRTLEGGIGAFLRSLHIQSILLVPIFVEGGRWGYLGIHDCHTERSWTTAEREALQVLAEIIGAANARARYVSQLAEAQRIVENSEAVVYRSRAEASLPVTYVSANVSKWGYQPEQFTASPLFYATLVHPDDRARLAAWSERLLVEPHVLPPIEFRIRSADGSYRWAENRITPARDESGRLTGFEGMLLDITQRKKAEQQLDFANTILTTAMENSPNGFLVVDPDGRALAFNQRFVEMWKIPAEAMATRRNEALLQAVAESLQDPQTFLAQVQHLREHPEEKTHDELAFRDGRVFERHSAALYDSKQRYLGRISFFADITERKQVERELARLARTDVLTGLANRNTFLDRLELMFAATRRGASPFAVLYVDLDNFKSVNDTLGHPAGDALLRAVSQRMAANVRSTDVAARLGGDEFAVLQADAEDPSTAGALAAKIRAALAEPYRVEGSDLRVTATVGIALYSPQIDDPAEILVQADRALYRAKEEGRDRYRFHSRELDLLVHERITLSDELRKAIEHDQLELHYQPQMDIATGRIVGVEALIRWNHPQRGQLKPAAFLAAAERTGAIIPLGDWVLERACRQLREWRDQGMAPPVMAVNLSGAQLRLARDFNRKVAATLAKWNLAPEDLEFDVSESVLAGWTSTQPDVLEQLRDLGVRIAIDDFGSDYTSIGRVKAYHVKRFKIAPQFINSMTTDPVYGGVVRMMINLARQLGIEIIAKSVETEEQRDFLRSVTEFAQAQGYYYSEPLDSEHATELLRQNQKARLTPQEPALAGRHG